MKIIFSDAEAETVKKMLLSVEKPTTEIDKVVEIKELLVKTDEELKAEIKVSVEPPKEIKP